MKHLIYALTLVMGLALSSCNSAEEYKPMDKLDLNGAWEVVELTGTPLEETAPFLEFNVTDWTVSGNLGCNHLMSRVSFDDPDDVDYDLTAIKFDDPASTMMACPYLDIEHAFATALEETEYFGIDDKGQLWLMDDNHVRLVLLRRK
ncbi:MAG: META domain-containing protein [Porphyromonas sp.]|nr:META domain-containing protein [Porphyromonas sp.]